MWNQLNLAVSFLTILRLPFASSRAATPADLAGSFSWFPLVGFILGLGAVAPAYLLASAPPLMLAVLVTALLAFLTRGLHLDGLADMADGLGGGYTPERRLEIMKDSRTGPFGALALIFAVLFKVAALHTLILGHCWSGMLVAPVLSRLAMVLGAYRMPHARSVGGLATPFLENLTVRQVLAAGLPAVVIALCFDLKFAPLALGIVACCAWSARLLAGRRLGGMTGDVLGALNEVAEVAVLAAAAGYYGGYVS